MFLNNIVKYSEVKRNSIPLILPAFFFCIKLLKEIMPKSIKIRKEVREILLYSKISIK